MAASRNVFGMTYHLNSAPFLYLHHHYCQSQDIIFIRLLYTSPPGLPLKTKTLTLTHRIIHLPNLNDTQLNSYSVPSGPLEIRPRLTMDYPLDNSVEWKRQKLELWFLIATKNCPMVGTKKTRKSFQKYYCLQGVPEEQSFKKYNFMIKVIVFLLQFLKGNSSTAVQCTVGNSFLNWRKLHIICQYMFIFGKVITF